MERIWHGLGNEFSKLGQEVTFITRRDVGLSKEEIINGVRNIRVLRFKRSKIRFFDLLKEFYYGIRISFLLPKSDILVTNTIFLPTWVKTIKPNSGKVIPNIARYPKGQIYFYSNTDCLLANSKAIRDALISQTPSLSNKVAVIANPIDTVFLKTGESNHFKPFTKKIIIFF